MSIIYCLLILRLTGIKGYSNQLFTIAKQKDPIKQDLQCIPYDVSDTESNVSTSVSSGEDEKDQIDDPYLVIQKEFHSFLFGDDVELEAQEPVEKKVCNSNGTENNFMQYVLGNAFRSELFLNKSGVHLIPSEYMHRDYNLLVINKDYMQTAVNAFAIFLYGSMKDVERLPAEYILQSTRTISMMKIAREKLAATWKVVKGNKDTSEITYETLELYRPLFKYINSRDMANLNLSDDRILTYIGTHADLNRHQQLVDLFPASMLAFTWSFEPDIQMNIGLYVLYRIVNYAFDHLSIFSKVVMHKTRKVGVVASRYIKLNKRWTEPRYLNKMNNLLCGVPLTFMRRVSSNNYLQLSHQVFYHIRACDPLQRKFYLAMMTKTMALGKSYSWSAQDISRLGLLLAEVDRAQLAAINPEAMAGITPHVMLTMPPQSLEYFTETQLQYLGHKSLNILARKLKTYQDVLQLNGCDNKKYTTILKILFLVSNILLRFLNN